MEILLKINFDPIISTFKTCAFRHWNELDSKGSTSLYTYPVINYLKLRTAECFSEKCIRQTPTSCGVTNFGQDPDNGFILLNNDHS